MRFRITDAPTSNTVAAEINMARQRMTLAQEKIMSGKRINRPSDDPQGAAVMINLRTTQAEITQMKRNSQWANDALSMSDTVLNSYELTLDRARALFVQGASDFTT